MLKRMDILLSLILLAVVVTPLCLVLRDLWPASRAARRPDIGVPTAPAATNTFPTLAQLEDMEDTMPACLRRSEWERPEAWVTDPRQRDEPAAAAALMHRR